MVIEFNMFVLKRCHVTANHVKMAQVVWMQEITFHLPANVRLGTQAHCVTRSVSTTAMNFKMIKMIDMIV